MLVCKDNREKFPTKAVGIYIMVNILLEATPKYIYLPAIHIMGFAPVGNNNYVNQVCNSLVLVPRHTYLLDSNLCKTLSNSVDYVSKIIV